ncbi:MAG: ABC transporter permease subunit [Bacteroidota bacterium]
MLRYIIKRLLLFVPIFFVVSMLAFGLSKLAPGDPAAPKSEQPPSSASSLESQRRTYRQNAAHLGLDQPAFYFKWTTAAYPDTLHRILPQNRRVALEKLCAQYGNWEDIQAYYHQLLLLEQSIVDVPYQFTKNDHFITARNATQQLFIAYEDNIILARLADISSAIKAPLIQDSTLALSSYLGQEMEDLTSKYEQVKEKQQTVNQYIPKFYWYGFSNQYHRWMSLFLKGDFGQSQRDLRPVADKIRDGLYWTLIINGTAILLAYLFSIPLGVWSALQKGKKADRSISLILFLLYSLPSFWIATLLLVFFTSPQYSMDWFPSIGLGNSSLEDDSFWMVFFERAGHLLLPVFCVTYAALAFITRQVRAAMVEVLAQDYIRTARAKGLNERRVIWKHAFRNALFPLITLFASLFPSLIAGSVIIEIIFNIPGMGSLLFDSIFAQDWPVVYSILMIGAVLTMLGILVADLLYALVDPRVRLE